MRGDTFSLGGCGSLYLHVGGPSYCSPSWEGHPREPLDVCQRRLMIEQCLLVFEIEIEDIHEGGKQRLEILTIGLICGQACLDRRLRLRNQTVAINQQLLL